LSILKEEYRNVKFINLLYEKGKSSYKQRIYNFTYMSVEEFSSYRLGFISRTFESPDDEENFTLIDSRIDPGLCEDIPDYKNWSEDGKILPVLDQGFCSCCYIFASIGTIENAVAVEYNLTKPVRLSTQHTLQCMKNITGGVKQGCEGDTPETIWRYVVRAPSTFLTIHVRYEYSGMRETKVESSQNPHSNYTMEVPKVNAWLD
jgi:hypothetical protein